MTEIFKTVDAVCPVCPENSSVAHASGIDFEYGTTGAREWTFRQCRICATLFLSPRPAPNEMGRIYPSNYYAYDFTAKRSLGYKVKAILDRSAAKKYLSLLARPGKILDVGCGDGRLLGVFFDLGVEKKDLHGLELDEPAVSRAQKNGLQVQRRSFEDAEYPKETFELIILQQVIEHVGDPAAVLRKIRDLLAPGGHVVLETPNSASWDHALFASRYWGGYHIPRHFFLFNPRSLTRLLELNGLRVRKIEPLASPSFWIQSVHHWLAERGAPRFLQNFFRPHASNALALALFTGLDALGKPFAITSNMRVIAQKA